MVLSDQTSLEKYNLNICLMTYFKLIVFAHTSERVTVGFEFLRNDY